MKNTDALVKQLYPLVSNSMSRNTNKFKQVVSRFIDKRAPLLYDTCPCDRIYFGVEDKEDFYKSMGISEKEVNSILQKTYYYNIANFNPKAAQDEFTVTVLMIIRYFYLKKMKKELELATIYLAFSGKF